MLKLKRTDIRDGALWITQNKTGARLGINITGQPAAVITRINERPRKVIGAYWIQDDSGQPLTQGALRSRFDKARTLAKVDFQFRDIRARAATDTGDLAAWRPGALAKAAGSQKPGYDRALRQGSDVCANANLTQVPTLD